MPVVNTTILHTYKFVKKIDLMLSVLIIIIIINNKDSRRNLLEVMGRFMA